MPSTSLESLVRDVNERALSLHDATRTMPLAEFRRSAFETLRELVAFDSALYGYGILRDGIPEPHDIVLFEQTPELMTSWHSFRERDLIALESLRATGKACIYDTESIFERDEIALAHCRRFGLRHIASTARVHERARHLGVVSLYRASDTPFTERERMVIELFVPHFIQCGHVAVGVELRRMRASNPHSTCSVGLATREGILLEFEPSFIEQLVRLEPKWEGPELPAELRAALASNEGEWILVDRAAVRAFTHGEFVRVDLRRRLVADELTSRELQVSQRFAFGESAKEIATVLGIATNTVRAHLGRAYEKLGVENKAELATMLAGLD